MQLDGLLKHITYESVQGSQERTITDICYHSAKVKRGSLFVCVKGMSSDGHDYLWDAVKNGAFAVLVEQSYIVETGEGTMIYAERQKARMQDIVQNYGVTVVVVLDSRAALAELSAAFFDYPAQKLKMIGITGTKGKTTTAFLTAGILREAGYRTGVIGTIWIDNGREIIPAEHTTPESYDLQCYLAEMVENHCDCCVMEVSSQGIKMQRVAGIWFDIGVFLNIEPDHIGKGEHASFSEYLHCKSKLMQNCTIGIVNQDDPNVNRILQVHTCEVETFSTKHPSDMMSEDEAYYMIKGGLYSCFKIKHHSNSFTVQMQLPGKFNVYNALAAVSIAQHFRVEEGQIERALRQQMIPGRCENVSTSEQYVLLIDYAHNEMSLMNLLETLREFHPMRLVVLFGCGGNRSGLRRGKMGETAGRLADFTILTSDNPRWEDPEAILDDIEAGIKGTGGNYVRIADRRAAVAYAIDQAKEGDIIVLAGKGHEEYQEIKGVKYPMTEHELVSDVFAQRKRIVQSGMKLASSCSTDSCAEGIDVK